MQLEFHGTILYSLSAPSGPVLCSVSFDTGFQCSLTFPHFSTFKFVTAEGRCDARKIYVS